MFSDSSTVPPPPVGRPGGDCGSALAHALLKTPARHGILPCLVTAFVVIVQGGCLATSGDGAAARFDLSLSRVFVAEVGGGVKASAWSESRDLLAIGDLEGNVRLVRIGDGREVARRSLAGTDGGGTMIKAIALSPGGDTLYALTNHRSKHGERRSVTSALHVLALPDLDSRERVSFEDEMLSDIEVSGKGDRVVLVGDSVYWARVSEIREVRKLHHEGPRGVRVKLSARGEAYVGTLDGRVCVYDLRNNVLARTWKAHDRAVFGLAIDEKGGRIVTASTDRSARSWSGSTGERIGRLGPPDGPVVSVELSADRTCALALVGIRKCRLVVWSLGSGGAVEVVDTGDYAVRLEVGKDGERVLVVTELGEVAVWRVEGHGPGEPETRPGPDGRGHHDQGRSQR